jgi:hypothetical protein
MTGERKQPNDINLKGLVVFKEERSPKIIEQESISLEQIDQEDKIKIIHEFKPFGSAYRYTLLIANQSQAPILEAKIKVRFPEFVELIRCNPPECNNELEQSEDGVKQIKIQAKKIEANSQIQYSFFLTPLYLDAKGEIRSFLTFVNSQDYVRALDSKPILIMFSPITIERKILPTSQIKAFSESSQNQRAIRSIGIASNEKFDHDVYFHLLQQVMEDQNYQLITKIEKSRIAWYFGMDLVSGLDILVVAQIIKNKVEWFAVCKNPHIIISVLTKLVNEYIVLLILRKLIEAPTQVFNLECKKCGAVLPFFPKKGELMICENCNFPQILWA